MRQTRDHLDRTVPKRLVLDYLRYVPQGDPPPSGWPLVLFLHGAGERGDDLARVATHGPARRVEEGHELPFVLLSPLCPATTWWTDHVDALLALLDVTQEHLDVDDDRVYATGLSMGGEGVWTLAAHAPERFAALAPVCGPTRPERAGRHAHVPTWAFHGTDDPVVPVRHTVDMVRALERAGGSPRMTLYEGVGHDSWSAAYDDASGLYAWLLEQRRPPRPAAD